MLHIVQILLLTGDTVEFGSTRQLSASVIGELRPTRITDINMGTVTPSLDGIEFQFARHAASHIVEDARLLVIERIFVILPHLLRALQIEIVAVERTFHAAAVGLDNEIAQAKRRALILISQPRQWRYNGAITARMLRGVSISPSDASILITIVIERAIPAIHDILCQIFSPREKLRIARQLVSTEQFPCNPHLVIIDRLTVIAVSGVGSTVHTIDRPVLSPRIRSDSSSGIILLQTVIELLHELQIMIVLSSIQIRGNSLHLIQCLQYRVHRLKSTCIFPHRSHILFLLRIKYVVH